MAARSRHTIIRSLILLSVLLVVYNVYNTRRPSTSYREHELEVGGSPALRISSVYNVIDIGNTSRDCVIKIVVRGYYVYFIDAIPNNRITWCPRVGCNVSLVYSSNLSDILSANITFYSHLHRSPPLRDIRYLVQHRRSNQRWALMSFETPLRVARNTTLPSTYGRSFYNWLATYNPASDVPFTYGQMVPKTEHDPLPKLSNAFKLKSKLIAFVSSNCIHTKWPRLEFVQALKRYIDIDMYGKCGNLTCGVDDNCTSILQEYKFILALENSPCLGYISEKFWNAVSKFGSVAVVWGAEKKDYDTYTPPGSFIFVESFQSIERLAAYIKKVSANETLYNSHHQWRNFYRVKPQSEWANLPNDQQLCHAAERYVTEMDTGRITPFKDTNRKDWIESCRIPVHTKMERLPIPISI